jgi:hypothetical protein
MAAVKFLGRRVSSSEKGLKTAEIGVERVKKPLNWVRIRFCDWFSAEKGRLQCGREGLNRPQKGSRAFCAHAVPPEHHRRLSGGVPDDDGVSGCQTVSYKVFNIYLLTPTTPTIDTDNSHVLYYMRRMGLDDDFAVRRACLAKKQSLELIGGI